MRFFNMDNSMKFFKLISLGNSKEKKSCVQISVDFCILMNHRVKIVECCFQREYNVKLQRQKEKKKKNKNRKQKHLAI